MHFLVTVYCGQTRSRRATLPCFISFATVDLPQYVACKWLLIKWQLLVLLEWIPPSFKHVSLEWRRFKENKLSGLPFSQACSLIVILFSPPKLYFFEYFCSLNFIKKFSQEADLVFWAWTGHNPLAWLQNQLVLGYWHNFLSLLVVVSIAATILHHHLTLHSKLRTE